MIDDRVLQPWELDVAGFRVPHSGLMRLDFVDFKTLREPSPAPEAERNAKAGQRLGGRAAPGEVSTPSSAPARSPLVLLLSSFWCL